MGIIGRKQIEQLSGFTNSAIAYGIGSFITMLYLTDWKVITAYIPYYNGKYKTKD